MEYMLDIYPFSVSIASMKYSYNDNKTYDFKIEYKKHDSKHTGYIKLKDTTRMAVNYMNAMRDTYQFKNLKLSVWHKTDDINQPGFYHARANYTNLPDLRDFAEHKYKIEYEAAVDTFVHG